MDMKIKITTPPGMATGFNSSAKLRMLKKILLGKGIIKEEYINEEKTEIYWVIEIDVRHYPKLLRKIYAFKESARIILENKATRSLINKLADSPEDVEKLREMLIDGTTVEYIGNATAEELVEGQKTFWQRMKEKFIKTKEIKKN